MSSGKERRGRISLLIACAASWTGASLTACGDDDRAPTVAPTGQRGPTVSIEGQTMTSGFKLGNMRETAEVSSFEISRHPVTVGEFRRCVDTGVCSEPHERACYDRPGRPIVYEPNFGKENVADDVPVTCVGLENARQYCTYVGGRLPTLEEWLLAARGGAPKRFSWGDSRASCEQHAFGTPPEGLQAAPCALAREDVGKIGLHEAGASANGVQDVLLTPAELLDVSAEPLFSACRLPTDNAEAAGSLADVACLAYGTAPGAIDSVRRLAKKRDEQERSPVAYGFRCAW